MVVRSCGLPMRSRRVFPTKETMRPNHGAKRRRRKKKQPIEYVIIGTMEIVKHMNYFLVFMPHKMYTFSVCCVKQNKNSAPVAGVRNTTRVGIYFDCRFGPHCCYGPDAKPHTETRQLFGRELSSYIVHSRVVCYVPACLCM